MSCAAYLSSTRTSIGVRAAEVRTCSLASHGPHTVLDLYFHLSPHRWPRTQLYPTLCTGRGEALPCMLCATATQCILRSGMWAHWRTVAVAAAAGGSLVQHAQLTPHTVLRAARFASCWLSGSRS